LRDGDFALYRGSGKGLPPILLVRAENASLAYLNRLQHEYTVGADLDASWAARPIELSSLRNRSALVLEDPGGTVLDRLLGQPLGITEFLRAGISLAWALRQLHARGLIHKDIKPANILVDLASGGVWLTGFGIASRLPRERPNPEPPDAIAGTLAYMAPEQTGRMNRSIDARSDLYSLGVTFYEMLTGTLPFTAADPMEWVHCHIARQPVPPDERTVGIPRALSLITLKLLAKTAEERYQTAAGLEADLRRCLAEWEAHGRIDPFPLGAHDMSDRLLIPERLYGREHEIETLLACFDRVVVHGTPELVLVSGYSGVGKSSLVHELHRVLVPSWGLYASGKFDQYKRDIPYVTLAQAFQSLVRSLLSQREVELGRWRESLSEALDSNGQLIVDLVPELELIIGKQPAVPELPPQDAKKRFHMVFRHFLSVFAHKEHPLALFLDDLQWLDNGTLDLLEHLVTHPEVRHLLLVGAYRDNEVGPSHPLMRTLQAIRESDARVQEIVLTPLKLGDIGRLIADALHCAPERARTLAELVDEKTGGNPFFAIQFLIALADEGLLAFDSASAVWSWDIDRILAKNYSDNVVGLMVQRLKRLSIAAQDALKHLACLGNVAQIGMLSIVYPQPEQAIHAALWEAVRAGLIVHQGNSSKFLHDRIQQAAYSLFPEEHRAAVHLRIGRKLLASMTANELTEHLFEVANQLNRGGTSIFAREEKAQVATINLRTGRKAKASAAYASALEYFAAGMALLDERDWGGQHELKFNLSLECAECELLCGSQKKAAQQIVELLQRAASNVEFATASCLKINLHVLTGEHPQAIDSALASLRLFGIDLPAHPTVEQVRAEYEMVWQTLGGHSIESLIDLPLMTDPKIRAALQVLSVLAGPATFTDFQLFCLLACRMVSLSIQHGVSGAAAYGYACLGSVLGANFQRYREGYRLAQLACDLVEKHAFTAYDTKVSHAMGLAAFWTQPLTSVIELRRATTRTATERGDLTFACYGMHQSITCMLTRNDPLDVVWRESEMALDFARRAKFCDVVDLIVSQQRFMANMQGRDAAFAPSSDEQFDAAAFEAQLTAARTPTVICLHWIRELKARYLSGDYAEAHAAADKAKALLRTSTVQLQLLDYFYYTALTVAALYEEASADEQSGWRELLTAHREQLREWAENYPPTFSDKHALASAELARIEGRDADAMRLYEQAVQSAREHGFVQNEGVAHEVAGRFYAACGVESIAHAYLRDARRCYLRWGGLGKVRQLERLHPWLAEESAPSVLSVTIDAPVEQLDVGTVIKASQAVSGEIELSKLIATLMKISLEHAGAGWGLLILLRGGELRIEAEATTGRGNVEVTPRQSAVTPSELPESVLLTAIRTRESVLLDDAAASTLFSHDMYVKQRRPRSMLCLPLVKQAKVVGALYLENNLTPRVFTSAKLAVLELLASQAAISLENALLYADLQQENSERQRAEDALRRSEAYLAEAQALSHTGSFGWNTDSGEIYWSDETFKIFEYERSTTPTVALVMGQRVHPEDVATFVQVVERAAQNGQDFAHEYRLRLPDGRIKHIRVVAHAVHNAARDVDFVGAVMDITAVKKAEDAIRSSERELRVTIETLPAFVLRAEPNGSFDFISQSMLDYSGVSRDDWLGWGWMKATHPDDLEGALSEWRRALADGKPAEVEMRFRRADGHYRWFQGRCVPLRDETGSIVKWYSTIHDIEDRKRAEENLRLSEAELRESEEQWRDVFENNPTMYFMVDAARRIMAVNPLGAEQLGYRVDELVGQPVLSVIYEPDRDAMQEQFAGCLEQLGRTQSWETRKIRKDEGVLWVRETARAVPRANGTIVLMACEDITERKHVEAEKEHLETQLRRSQKMEAMGTLAGGIAHDFNNILGAILGYGELAQQAVSTGSDVRRYIDNVMNAGGRAKSLVDRILAFSRSGTSERSLINVQTVIEETLELLAAASLAPGVRLEKRLDAGGAAIVGDATQLHQVAMNLCTNAVQAMESGGLLAVTLNRLDVAQYRRVSHGTLAPGAYVRLTVSDTGSGIPPGVLDRMFDPFFTTKDPGKGTGLGLSLVHGIVTDLGGAIDVCTTIGCGTTFTVWMPAAGETLAPAAELTIDLPHGRGQTVLIVDNEKALVALTEEILAELGYEPIGFSSSTMALQAFRDSPQRFDIVLTDESMPELNGTDLARQVALVRPDLPILLMSGFAGAQLHKSAHALGIRELLRKPLQRKDIAECLGRVLNSTNACFNLNQHLGKV
jgi:PAS domain S-box-containing protein